MIKRRYKKADKVVEITSIFSEVHEYCSGYLTDEQPDYAVTTTQADIDISVPRGISMRPMIRGGKDAVVIEKLTDKLKRYDLVLYVRGRELGVIHRVIRVSDGKYIICGDNCWQLEYVRPDQIKGIVTE